MTEADTHSNRYSDNIAADTVTVRDYVTVADYVTVSDLVTVTERVTEDDTGTVEVA